MHQIWKLLPFIFDSGSFMNMAVNVNDPDVRAQINNGTLNYDDLLFVKDPANEVAKQ